MTTLILGGAGFVGLNIAEALMASGQSVVVFDRGAPPAAFTDHHASSGRLTVIEGDATDPAAVAAAAKGCDTLVHGAAITAGAAREARDPATILAVNNGSLVPALQAARDEGMRRVVILSSGSAYGEAGYTHDALPEETPCDPIALYSITKFASERIARRLGELYAVDVRVVRLSAVFGAWERDTGVRDTLSPHFRMMSALARGEPLVLDRAAVRDWIYAPDVGAAITALLSHTGPRHPVYNISTGQTWTVLDFAHAIAVLAGTTAALARPGETPTVRVAESRDRAPMVITRMLDDLPPVAHPGCEAAAEAYWAWWQRFGPAVAG
ncbi:NAD(P)-dependent oxidoreductase [Acuticoccus sp. I52.16.1]|uniref:NAD-dependent epimerase/dehydratase family protein n=1 Tax=Acuticoccus sp. I52.16.1 TaxID=2928472 RepID=UPI001FD183A4|nr:NAD(P)-dependent oxidoreductase [Acuticoccus sp. I52.16.1]UOM34241.1 NAD(P)-dependent oxidoreductase [Acuticoccus sp. I52.16.1]